MASTHIHTIAEMFTRSGGTFLSEPAALAQKLSGIRGFLFDWDGVFNDGSKGAEHSSGFSEADSLGVNLLRFAWWKASGADADSRVIPYTGILTGMNNPSADYMAKREHYHCVYAGFRNKPDAFSRFLNTYQLKPEEVCYIFDDVLDLPVARLAGVRFLIRRDASPLFRLLTGRTASADYVTFTSCGGFAVRECCELLLGLAGHFDTTIEERIAYTADFQKYMELRKQINPVFEK